MARREHHEVGIDTEPHELVDGEAAIFALPRREQQRAAKKRPLVDLGVRGEVQHADIGEARPDETRLPRLRSDEHVGTRRITADLTCLRRSRRQSWR